jgi:hypothetical protein
MNVYASETVIQYIKQNLQNSKDKSTTVVENFNVLFY